MSATTILTLTALAALVLISLGLVLGASVLLVADRRDGTGTEPTMQWILGVLDRPWRIERWIYRHHRLVGTVIVFAAGFCIWQLASIRFFPEQDWLRRWSLALDLLLAAQLLNVLVGSLIFIRPSLLKPAESIGNRWHTLSAPGRGSNWSRRARALVLVLIGVVTLISSAGLIARIVDSIL